MKRIFIALVILCASRAAFAHKPSDSYLTLRATGHAFAGRWDIALRDIDYAIGLDASGDGKITWGELTSRRNEVFRFALTHLEISRGGQRCTTAPLDLKVVKHSDGTYASLTFRADCAVDAPSVSLTYSLLFDFDKTHRGLMNVVGAEQLRVFENDHRTLEVALERPSRFRQLVEAAHQGVHHIWEGIDHLLFLLALLLPSVLRREGGKWRPVERFGPAFVDVFKVVTAFTLAHSITLSLAALDVVRLPSRFVESAIALSVFVAAVNNLAPGRAEQTRRRWIVAFALGLLHGFGLSATLTDLGLTGRDLLMGLFGFNVGVELGQGTVVAIFVPLAFLLRRTRAYLWLALRVGSVIICALALVWFVERAFGLRIIN